MNKTNEKQGNNTGKEIKRVIKSIIDKEMKFYRNEKKEKNNKTLLNELNGEELLLIASVKLTNELIHKIENDELSHNTYMIFNKIIRVRDETITQISRKIGTSEKRLVNFLCGEKQQKHLKLKNDILDYLFGVTKPEYLLYSNKEIKKIKEIKRRKEDTKAEIIDYPYNTKEYMEKAIESIAEGLSEVDYDR